MNRSRPHEFEFVDHDDAGLLARMAEVKASGSGWINVEPIIDEEYEPPEPTRCRPSRGYRASALPTGR